MYLQPPRPAGLYNRDDVWVNLTAQVSHLYLFTSPHEKKITKILIQFRIKYMLLLTYAMCL